MLSFKIALIQVMRKAELNVRLRRAEKQHRPPCPAGPQAEKAMESMPRSVQGAIRFGQWRTLRMAQSLIRATAVRGRGLA